MGMFDILFVFFSPPCEMCLALVVSNLLHGELFHQVPDPISPSQYSKQRSDPIEPLIENRTLE